MRGARSRAVSAIARAASVIRNIPEGLDEEADSLLSNALAALEMASRRLLQVKPRPSSTS